MCGECDVKVQELKKTAIMCFGNPSRGDDALAHFIFERLEKTPGDIELFRDYQLQIEHALDLQGRDRIIFIDAAVHLSTPFEMREIMPVRDASYSTHALSPEALLDVYERILKKTAPEAYLLSVRGESFGLGEPLSHGAENSLEAACDFLKDFLSLTSDFGKAAIPG